MKQKIKNLFSFLGRAWSGGWHGKVGILLTLFAMFMFVRIFIGTSSLQNFVINIWKLNNEQQQLMTERAKLEKLNRHIELLQGYSSDYVEELGLKYLNIGDPKAKILKI